MVVEEIISAEKFVIYGAQVVAYGAYRAIIELTGKRPICFAVGKSAGAPTYPVGNLDNIEGIPVTSIDTVSKDTLIIVGVTELIQKEVLPFLSNLGYKNVFSLTCREEHLLMSEYYNRINKFPLAINKQGKGDLVLYEVRNDRDKELAYHPSLLGYERSIQAGAALVESRIADLSDDTGISISGKNRMYCEMTAAYWVWKNTDHEWVGIEHYRRHLLVDPGMLDEGIDAILPLPYICYPNEATQFQRFVSEDVFNALLQALKAVHPDEYERYRDILYSPYQYTYNLLCARREVFNEYCEWLFGITEYMEEHMGSEVPELLNTRAFSYISEVLTNLFFMSHSDRLRILHTEKEIYV